MSANIEIRRKQLENLEQFIGDTREKLQSILDCLGWKESRIKEKEMVTCSVDKNHKVPAESLEEHQKKCKLRKLNYDLNGLFLSEPIHDPRTSIYISNQQKRVILTKSSQSSTNFKKSWNGSDEDPQTSDRLTSMYSVDERLALYDYAKSVTSAPEKPKEFNIIDDDKKDDKELTYEELLEQERNAKRRRIKYKAVHTSKKNHTEVLRDVISNQMELYQNWVSEKEGAKSERKLDGCEKKNSEIDKRNFKHSKDYKKHDDYDRKRHRSRDKERSRSRRRSRSPYKHHRRSNDVDKRSKYDHFNRKYK